MTDLKKELSQPENSDQNLKEAGKLFEKIKEIALKLTPKDSLKMLLTLDNELYALLGYESVRYGNGIHTKHKHISYHDFFVKHTPAGSCVLDVGCGNGALTFDIASKIRDTKIFGMDLNTENIKKAKQQFFHSNIDYRTGNVLEDLPKMSFDVIIMSNVLEHIEHRVDFLKQLIQRYSPSLFLFRVPIFERDWRVPLKQELGIPFFLDQTHFIEYRPEEFYEELSMSGLKITYAEIKWGEIWSKAVIV